MGSSSATSSQPSRVSWTVTGAPTVSDPYAGASVSSSSDSNGLSESSSRPLHGTVVSSPSDASPPVRSPDVVSEDAVRRAEEARRRKAAAVARTPVSPAQRAAKAARVEEREKPTCRPRPEHNKGNGGGGRPRRFFRWCS